jgi:hypothetical protein
MKKLFVFALSLMSFTAFSDPKLSFDALVDVYYAYDFNLRPTDSDTRNRDFSTQAVRHDEFNANLVSLGMKVEQGRINGRLALQAGTSVTTNYAAELEQGYDEGSLSRHIQEAYLTYALTDETRMIGGIFFSHIGSESFISLNNWTYTRSLAADYSPYYQSGVGIIHEFNQRWTLEAYLLNGWQNISEDDGHKALGAALRHHGADYTLNYTNFFGHYQGQRRHFHDVNIQYKISDEWALNLLFDQGWQQNVGQTQTFYTYNAIFRYRLNQTQSLSFRYEHYHDPHNLNITEAGSNGLGFKVNGYSVTYDHQLENSALWRVEVRKLHAEQNIFAGKNGEIDHNLVFVTSLGAKF